jgi:Rha family phage regulatory protein
MAKKDDTQLSLVDAENLLHRTKERLLANSVEVAERFGKIHKNVLRSIEGIECSEEFYRLNFEPVNYVDRRGFDQPMFNMTRDGFSLLVMGFTGTKAMLWKERYIQAFNMLEAVAFKQSIELAETRGRSKTVRVAATDAYKEHGATEWFHYVNNTDAIYEIMFGGNAAQLRKRWNLPNAANVRDRLSASQLNAVIQIEGAVTLQLDERGVFHPDDQLTVIRHVARGYRALIEAPMPDLIVSKQPKKAA